MTSKEVSMHVSGSSVSIDAVGKPEGITCESLRVGTNGGGYILVSDEDVDFAEVDIQLEDLEKISKILSELITKLKKDKDLNES